MTSLQFGLGRSTYLSPLQIGLSSCRYSPAHIPPCYSLVWWKRLTPATASFGKMDYPPLTVWFDGEGWPEGCIPPPPVRARDLNPATKWFGGRFLYPTTTQFGNKLVWQDGFISRNNLVWREVFISGINVV
jgi:hypothetical protein